MSDYEQCQRCGRSYVAIYWLPDDVWATLRSMTGANLLCPLCADSVARQAGIGLFWSAGVGAYEFETLAAVQALADSRYIEIERLRAELADAKRDADWQWTERCKLAEQLDRYRGAP